MYKGEINSKRINLANKPKWKGSSMSAVYNIVTIFKQQNK